MKINPMARILFLGLMFTAFYGCEKYSDEKLPIMGWRDVKQVETDGQITYDTIYHTIPDFRFMNQDSLWITPETFRDKIYVADFFFTTCPTICPVMKTQMLRVYEKFKDNDQVLLLSHSIDPVHDSVPVLKEFAERLGIDANKWHFVTGDKDEIYDIGEKSYLVTAQEDADEPGGYVHSGAFILVDKEKRVRGYYDGTLENDVDRLIRDIPRLLKEYK
jgi:protein SCO1